ncbi:hypothetical protein [Hydrogenimonas sp.]
MKMRLPLALLLLSGALFGSDSGIEAIVKKFESLEAFRIPAAVEYRIYDPFKRAAPRIKTGATHRHIRRQALPKVTAIMNDRAFMEGRWVRAGERVGGYRVLEIRKGGVLLKRGGSTRLLPLTRREKNLLNIKDNQQ